MFFVLLPGLSACGSSTSTSVTAPTDTSARCEPSIRGSQTTFGPAGGAGTLAITISRECTWKVDSLAGWLELTSPREGQGDGSVSYRALANGEPVVRRGALAVNGSRLDVTQDGAPCHFDVSRSADTIGADGGQLRMEVAAHSACRWTASSSAPWVTLSPPSGSGAGAVQVSVQSNPGEVRSATVVVAGQSFPFTQSGRSSPPPPAPNPPAPAPGPPPSPPPGPSCTYLVSPQQREFSAVGGTGLFSVTAPAGCTWTASSSAGWVLVSDAGSGNGEVDYLVLPTLSREERQATITVNGAVHRVSQRGLSDDDDDDDERVQVSGRVSDVSGTCPNLRFVVRGSVVSTNSNTGFARGSCGHVVNGMEVDVEGTRQSDGSILARKVELNR